MANDLQLITDSFSKFIVTPINSFGLGGFVFDNDGDTTVTLQAEITDHYTEDNKTIQDHIAIKPKRVTLKGYIGELVYRDGDDGSSFVQKAVQKLTTVSSFIPKLSAAASQATDLIQSARDGNISLGNVSLESVNKVLDLWGLVKNMDTSGSKQAQAYMYFKALYEQKILCSLQTPYEFLSNMAIESIIALQPEGTKYVSDFTITLKQIRTVDVLSAIGSDSARSASGDTTNPTPISQGRNAEQAQAPVTVGNMQGLETTVNFPDVGPVKINTDILKNLPQFDYDKIIGMINQRM